MSFPEPTVESKSSVKISMDAKGEAKVEVKIYDGAEKPEVDRIRDLAIDTYKTAKAGVR